MSDQPDCINVNNSIDNDIDILSSSSPPRKKLKLSPNKTRTARLIPEKMHAPLTNYSWKFIDKNEAMMAELSGGKLTLWQFLLELLMSEEYSNLIKWTDRNIGEFILIQAEEVAKLWGIRKDRNHRMNYDKLSRALRYYYQKNIIKKVHGHKFVYRFVSLLPEMIPSSSSSHKSNNNCNNNISSTTTTTNTTSNTNGNSNGNSNQCESLNNNQSSSATEEDQISLDKCKSRSLCSSRNHQTLLNASRLPNKNLKKSDFNSTLSALFQAALLSLSGCNNDLSGGLFSSHKDSSDQCICSSDESINNPSSSRIFDLVNQNNVSSHHECICQPDLPPIPSSTTTGLFIPGSGCSASHIQPLPFDRQSLLHFSRHSINMQRLSQEIRLHSCNNSKSLLKPHLTNPLLSPSTESVDGIIDSSHPNFWLNQFAQDLFNSTSSSQNRISNPDKLPFTPPSQDEGDGSEVKIKTEKVNKPISSAVESENFNNLTSLFQKFIKDMESKNESAIAANDSIATISGISPHVVSEYCHLDLANLIKSQLETHSSFVWMPIPVKFAEEIMKYSIKSEPSDQSN